MTREEWMQEGIDLKLLLLLLLRRIGVIAGAGVLGALLAGGGYLLVHAVYPPTREYQAVSRYYIDFTVDENGDRAYDYYNAATWNDVAASDPILDYTMSLLPPDYDRETVRGAVFCEQPSDYRIITTTVTTGDAQMTERIQKATEASILHYGQEREEFAGIEVIWSSETQLVALQRHTAKVFVLGGIAGVIISTVLLCFFLILHSAVHVERLFEQRYGYPVLGVFLRRGRRKADAEWEPLLAAERACSLSYLARGRQIVLPLWDREQEQTGLLAEQMHCGAGAGLLEHPEQCETLREADGVILAVPGEEDCGRQIEKAIGLLRRQDCKITGAILYDVDARLYGAYYGRIGGRRDR